MAVTAEVPIGARPVYGHRRVRLGRAVRPTVRGNPPMPAPLLHHVFVVLDDAAYRDVLRSRFLREDFGRVTESTGGLAGPGTGLAVAGENTVLELVPAGAAAVPGESGFVLSYETPGSIDAARERLDDRGASPLRCRLVRRTVAGSAEPQPWYHLVQPELDAHSPVRVAIAEPTPECFAHLGARADAGRLTRRAYLDAVLGRPAAPQLRLRDVAEVTVRLRAHRARRLVATLEALGYAGTGSPDGRWLTGPDARFRVVVDEAEAEGVLAIRLRLNRPSPHHHRFGDSSVLAGDVWTFRPGVARPQTGHR